MPPRKKKEVEEEYEVYRPRRPATTPQARENQIVAKAVDLAERQIDEGTVSSQVLSIYLNLATSREYLQQERLELENQLTQAKIEAMASASRLEELMGAAIDAFKTYAPTREDDDFDRFDD